MRFTKLVFLGIATIFILMNSCSIAQAFVITPNPIQDTWLSSASQGPHGTETGLKSGNSQTAYLLFNLSTIPTGSSVSSAVLYMYGYSLVSGNTQLDAYGITSGPWAESMTWSSRPTVSSTSLDYVTINSTVGWYDWDITSLVQGWVNGSSNYGVAIHDGLGDKSKTFYSRESTTNPPYLSVTYTTTTTDPIPEPASFALLGLGLVGLIGLKKRKA